MKENITVKDLQNIHICVECAEENPGHLEQSGSEHNNALDKVFNDVSLLSKSHSINRDLGGS